tara:strand:+ start:283 stop:489 length:207 start_codon:yes stop_codon:yes gene_type:complete
VLTQRILTNLAIIFIVSLANSASAFEPADLRALDVIFLIYPTETSYLLAIAILLNPILAVSELPKAKV